MSYHPGVQVLGGTYGCFCCASRTRMLIKHDAVVPLQRCLGSHRGHEAICSGVQCSQISTAWERMCRDPCTLCLLQYHLHTHSHPTAMMRLTMQLTIRWCRVHGSRVCPWPARLGINHSSATLANCGPVAICVFAIFTDTASGWLHVGHSATPLSFAELPQPSSRLRSTTMVSDS